MKRKWILVSMSLVVLLLAAGVGVSQAQGPETPEAQPLGVIPLVSSAVSIQGRLTDASGNPLNGLYNITARIYTEWTGGTEICGDMYGVTVDNGLFDMKIDDCSASDISGAQLWLGIKVGDDPEMDPRQPIYPVPYAWSLRPGAIINNTAAGGHGLEVSSAGSGASGSALWLENTNAGGIALWATNSSVTSNDASLVVGNSGTGPLIKGFGSDGGEDEFRVNNDGSIWSEADTEIAVSPLKMVTNSNVMLRVNDNGYMEVRPIVIGNLVVYVPVDLPSVLFGTTTKLKSVRVCYADDQAASYIASTTVDYVGDLGSFTNLISNATDRTSYTWECYTLTDDVPNAIQGSLSVRFVLHFAGIGGAHDIQIGRITLTLTEQ